MIYDYIATDISSILRRLSVLAVRCVFARILLLKSCKRLTDEWVKRINYTLEEVKDEYMTYVLICSLKEQWRNRAYRTPM